MNFAVFFLVIYFIVLLLLLILLVVLFHTLIFTVHAGNQNFNIKNPPPKKKTWPFDMPDLKLLIHGRDEIRL